MEILIIEDNNLKFKLIEGCFQEIDQTILIHRASSYQSGIETLVKQIFDYVILDMTLPVFDIDHSMVGTEDLTFGGELILRDSQRRHLAARFIVLSQYDTFVRDTKEITFEELRIELLSKYTAAILGCVRLDSLSVGWKTELKALISSI